MKAMIIDGFSLVSRAFFATPLLSTSSGVYTNAVNGFAAMLLRLTTEYPVDYLAVAFDRPEPTFRRLAYEEYKGTRQKMPEELYSQFDLVRELLSCWRIPIVEQAGLEADDILGSLSQLFAREDVEVLLVTGDRDAFQLVEPLVRVLYLSRSGVRDMDLIDETAIASRYGGLTPGQLIDLKALMGDSSDNIPGVPKVGEKTAIQLLKQHGSLEEVLANPESGTTRTVRENLVTYAEQARLSYFLARIVWDDPLQSSVQSLADLCWKEVDFPALAAFYRRYDMRQLLTRLNATEAKTAASNQQQGLILQEAADGSASMLNTAPSEGMPVTALEAVKSAPTGQMTSQLVDYSRLDILLNSHQLLAVTWSLPKGVPRPSSSRWRKATVQGESLEATLEFLFSTGDLVGTDLTSPVDCLSLVHCSLAPSQLSALGSSLHSRAFLTWRVKELCHLLATSLPNVEDLALLAYLCDPGKDPELRTLSERFFSIEAALPLMEEQESQTESAVTEKPDSSEIKVEAKAQTDLAGDMASPLILHTLWLPMLAKLKDLGLESLYRDIELPLAGVLTEMEEAGIQVDTKELHHLGQEFSREMKILESSIHTLVGEVFNLNSPKQLGNILFDKLGLPGGRKTKTGYSTDAEALEGLLGKHEVIELLLRYRMLAKLQGTYIEGLIPLVEIDGRLRTTFHQTVVATGRLSSSDPNLQNIPIRHPEGRLLRKAFIPTTPEWRLVAADYSQIELRILAHLSQDARFIDAYHQGQDIHRRTASEVFDTPLDQVTSAQRSLAKAVIFGVVYGISDYGLATQLGISRSQASEFINRFFQRYPRIRTYQQELVALARSQGFVTTIFNRRRYLPEIHSRNHAIRSYAERTALNTPIQGSAADLIKLAMLRLDREMRQRGLASRILLQVHDDLLCESPLAEVAELSLLMQETMINAISLSVPLEVEIGVADSWYAVKD